MKRRESEVTRGRSVILRMLSQAGLTGACFALAATGMSTWSVAQDTQSSRRNAANATPVSTARQDQPAPLAPPAPPLEMLDEVPARLPPVQYEMLPVGPPNVPGAGPEEMPVYEDVRDVYGRPMNVGRHGIKYALQDCYWGFPEYFEERPLNLYNQRAFAAMIGNGQGDFLVLYEYDFHDGKTGNPSQLNEAGYARLQRIVRMVKGQPRTSAVVVEALPGQERLNRERQQEVAAMLARFGVSERSALVSLGKPRRGLLGDEASPVYRNMINMSASQGRSGVTGTVDPTVNNNTTGTSSAGALR
ncbi:MAG: hypothetical protein U0939_07735 [Pirellulales bacterium]